jgi:hypothetical protein
MLILLRILFTGGWLCLLFAGARAEQLHPVSGDMECLFYFTLALVLSIPMAAVWTPYLASALCGTLTGALTGADDKQFLGGRYRFLAWTQKRGLRRLTVFNSFWLGVFNPHLPKPFLVGLSHARKGSALELFFAREVYRFDNAENSRRAAEVLARHGVNPGPHWSQQVNLIITRRSRSPSRKPLPLTPAAPAEKLRRNPRILLFKSAETFAPSETKKAGDTRRIPRVDDTVPEVNS